MINMFKNKSNHQYKTATIIKEDRTQHSFKYRKTSNVEIQKILRSSEEFIIATSNEFDFSILQVNIDDIRYKILDAYKEDNVNSNGLFRNKFQVTTYITCGR